jgi:hypothetical protein
VETTAGDVTSKTVCCFGPATTLQFRVSAYTLTGFSDPSDPSNQVTTPGFTVPGAPSDVLAAVDQLNPGSATVEWSVTTDGGDNWVLAAEVDPLLTEATVPCGGPGTTCQYRVSAVNSAGVGSPSAPSNEVTIP